MFLKKQYHFSISQEKETLTQALKDLSKDPIIMGDESYSVEFNWDEFVVSRKAKMFERSAGIEPDAHIRLVSLSENHTQVAVKITFSEIVWIILVFVQLGILAGCLFGIDFNWWYRVLILIGSSGLFYFIIWLILVQGVNSLKQVITQLFRDLEQRNMT